MGDCLQKACFSLTIPWLCVSCFPPFFMFSVTEMQPWYRETCGNEWMALVVVETIKAWLMSVETNEWHQHQEILFQPCWVLFHLSLPQVPHLFKCGWWYFLLLSESCLFTDQKTKSSMRVLITVCGSHRFVLAAGISRKKNNQEAQLFHVIPNEGWASMDAAVSMIHLQVVIPEISFLCFDLD